MSRWSGSLLALLLVAVGVVAGCRGPEATPVADEAPPAANDTALLEAEIARLRARVAELEADDGSTHSTDSTHSTHEVRRVELAGTEVRTLRSSQGETYQIKVKLPRGYDATDDRYPVLYVTDAETNFGGVSYIVQRLIKDGLIPEILVVGIAYDTDYRSFYSLRSRDLTPTALDHVRVGGRRVDDPTGGADAFLDFFERDLFPFVESSYRARPGERALYGHSYGGLFGCYVLLTRPGLFNKYLVLAPSLWFDDTLLLRRVQTADLRFDRPTRLYLGSGSLEHRIDDFQVEFAETLRKRDVPQLTFESQVLENETHRTVFGRGFTDGLRFLYSSSS